MGSRSVKDFTRAVFFDVGGNEDVVVAYNQMIRTYLFGIQWVNAGAGSQVHNNLFYDFGKGTNSIRSAMRTGWSLSMYNNIFYNPSAGRVIFSAHGPVTADHNIFYPDAGGFTPGANSQIGDPGFVDAGIDDFHLSTGTSIAVDAGTDLGYATDLEGTALVGPPDVGPLEWSRRNLLAGTPQTRRADVRWLPLCYRAPADGETETTTYPALAPLSAYRCASAVCSSG